jgi:hypothetical protein
MKYLLLICADPDLSPTDDGPTIEEWLAELGDRRLDGDRLESPKTAITVRTRGGEVFRSDGPFAETKEFVGGYDVIDVDSEEEAVRIASRHPCARFGAVEVRRFPVD